MYFSRFINTFLQKIVDTTFSCLSLLLYLINPLIKPIFDYIFKLNGIEINGGKDYNIQVKDNRFYGMAVAKGLTGFFDAFLDGYITCENLLDLFAIINQSKIIFSMERYHPYRLIKYTIHRYFDVLTEDIIENISNDHYEDQAVEIYEAMGSLAHYSTMLLYEMDEVREDMNLQEIDELLRIGTFRARENIAKKLKLEPGMKILDIGCGFGGLARHLADKYKVSVTGVTICNKMAEIARKECKGLPVKIINNDYRAIKGKFDRIVSIEMFEHVGENHHREYFKKVNSLLKDDGIFILQAHSFNHDYLFSYTPTLEKIFKMYCYFPKLEEIVIQSRGLLIIEDVQNLGFCFAVMSKALLQRIQLLKSEILKYKDERSYNFSMIYGTLSMSMAMLGRDKVYQIVFSKDGLRYAYTY